MKGLKVLGTLIVSIILMLVSTISVVAVENTIQLGDSIKLNAYISGVEANYIATTDNECAYYLFRSQGAPDNTTATLFVNSRLIDGGVEYILKNGYPYKSYTGVAERDYYITQTALWWYLDSVYSTRNLDSTFKTGGTDTLQLRPYIKALHTEAYSHRGEKVAMPTTTNVELAIEDGNTLTLKDGYYTSNIIKSNTNNTSYTISLENAPTGTKVVFNDVTETTYTKAITLKGTDTFRVKIPSSEVSSTDSVIKVNAASGSVSDYTVCEYTLTNNTNQGVVLLKKGTSATKNAIELKIGTTRVTINNRDSNTKENIAGAQMRLKDSTGKEVASFTSTTNAYVVQNLPYGAYVLEEVAAPNGYLLNTNVTNFTLSESQKAVTINYENGARKALVSISVLDQNTRAQLSGATIIIRNSNGAEVARFVSTTNAYTLTDIPLGTYTAEEISAPYGYALNSEKLTFTIEDSHLSHQVNIVNVQEIPVPNTDTTLSAIILAVLGIGVIGMGFKFVKSHA